MRDDLHAPETSSRIDSSNRSGDLVPARVRSMLPYLLTASQVDSTWRSSSRRSPLCWSTADGRRLLHIDDLDADFAVTAPRLAVDTERRQAYDGCSALYMT